MKKVFISYCLCYWDLRVLPYGAAATQASRQASYETSSSSSSPRAQGAPHQLKE